MSDLADPVEPLRRGPVAGIDSQEHGPVDAPLVALAHGALDRSAGMARIGRRLDRTHRVLRYDRRGYGRSRPHPGPFTLAANADDLIALLDERPAVLVGHSLGSHVVLKVAEARPDLVLGVVAYEPPVSWESWWPGSTGRSFAGSDIDPGDAAEAFMRRMTGDDTWEGLPAGTRASRRAEGVAFVGEIDDLRLGPPWNGDSISIPVVIGYGGDSRDHHVKGAQLLAARLVGGRSVELTGCGHGAHSRDAGLFVDALVTPMLEEVLGDD